MPLVQWKENNVPTYKIPISWTLTAELDIEADSVEDAIFKAEDANLPRGEYLDSSFDVNVDIISQINPNSVFTEEDREYLNMPKDIHIRHKDDNR
jgi:hypothetical protein